MTRNSRVVILFFIWMLISHLSSVWASGQPGGIELHAHLFMKEGMGWVFRGNFNEPLKATDWKDRFSSQANPKALDESGLSIVVATLYAHPLFTLSLRDSIRHQLSQAQEFIHTHPNWVLARSPAEARAAIRNGKRVLILALEGASGILEDEADLKEFVDKGGIRILTLLHLTDDWIGGVAFLPGVLSLSSPIAWFGSLFSPHHDSEGVRVNGKGLTDAGKAFAEKLIRRKVWIDLSHASDESQKDLIPLLERGHQPLLYTHTALRKYLRAERGISGEQLTRTAETRGVIGIMPSEQMLDGTPISVACHGSLEALATQYQEIVKVVGDAAVDMGSDINGGIPHLRPSCKTGTSLDREGFWNIAQSSELWKAMEAMNPNEIHPHFEEKLQYFLKAWTHLWD